jgi:hypothetical protein
MALPAEDDAPALLVFLDATAALWWTFCNVKKKLDDMSAEQRDACPDFEALRADALAGMTFIESRQREARRRLEALSAFPTRWAKWPERRQFPRFEPR